MIKPQVTDSYYRAEIEKHLRHNVVVNILDGGFFGFALGFASFVTVLPLFVSTMTDSATLIGLIPAIHSMGWQLPQLLTVNAVSRRTNYRPMVLLMTLHERLPFLGLALVALFLPRLGNQLGLVLTFLLLIWQGLGGGFTATAWQSMIGKIIPANRRATFFGMQSAFANALSSLAAVAAGVILERYPGPTDFMLLFLLAGLTMILSLVFLALTREPEHVVIQPSHSHPQLMKGLARILRTDANFRGFIIARLLSQFGTLAFAFYTVYAVKYLGMDELQVGIMTGVLLGSQIASNPIMGWIADHWSHRGVMMMGLVAAGLSALLAAIATEPAWYYLVFILSGIANVAIWTIALAMIQEFGTEQERTSYIGLANTLVAPATILAPFIGGWLADSAGYPAAFVASAVGAVAALVVYLLFVNDPRRIQPVEELEKA